MSLGMPRHVLSPKILHLYVGRSGPPSNTWFLKPSWILNPNSILIGLAIVERPYTLQWPPFPPQNCPFPLWSGSHLIHVSLGPSEFSTQTAHYIYTFIYIFGGSCLLTEFCQLQLALHPSLAFSYIGSITARHCSSGRQPNCGVVQGMKLWNFHKGATYIRLGSHHVGHRPTF